MDPSSPDAHRPRLGRIRRRVRVSQQSSRGGRFRRRRHGTSNLDRDDGHGRRACDQRCAQRVWPPHRGRALVQAARVRLCTGLVRCRTVGPNRLCPKTSSSFCPSLLSLASNDLVFADEIDLAGLHAQHRLVLTLVDHNRLSLRQAGLASAVTAVLDHHADEGGFSSASPRVIEPVGSATSLVVREAVRGSEATSTYCAGRETEQNAHTPTASGAGQAPLWWGRGWPQARRPSWTLRWPSCCSPRS